MRRKKLNRLEEGGRTAVTLYFMFDLLKTAWSRRRTQNDYSSEPRVSVAFALQPSEGSGVTRCPAWLPQPQPPAYPAVIYIKVAESSSTINHKNQTFHS